MFLKKSAFLAASLAMTLATTAAHAGIVKSTLKVAPGSNVCLFEDQGAINSVFAAGNTQPKSDGTQPSVRFRLKRSLTGQEGTFDTIAAESFGPGFSFAADSVTRPDLVPGHFRLCVLNPLTIPVFANLDLRTS